MDSEATVLEQKLIAQINRDGPITFRDFMQAALYDAELGYYNTKRAKVGGEGDFYTSGNVHPAFGAILARAFAELWSDPRGSLTLVELGAGTGQLAHDVLAALRDEQVALFASLSYIIIETSPAMLALQREKLAAFSDCIRWCELKELERMPIAGIIFSNEFVDAMPVHRVRLGAGGIEEQYVTATSRNGATRLSSFWGKPSLESLAEYITRMGVRLQEGQVIEINLDAVDWLRRMGPVLKEGFLVTIDYGDLVRELLSPYRSQGTLRSFYRHRLIDSPFERVGDQDITASVNFTALIEYGSDFGFDVVSFERQTAFLTRFGLIERIAAVYGESDSMDDLKERLAVKNLFVPGGVSDSFRVLIQRKSRT